MDATDLAILREMSRDKVMWWGSLDPRLSASAIADRLALPRTTVRERLRAWARSGFLQGTETIPNPRLFGVALAGGSIRAADARTKPRLLADLALVDGLVFALDHVGEWIAIDMIHDSAQGLERRRRLLAALPGVAALEPCVPHRVTEPRVEPTPLDWRILAALRAGTARPLGAIAREAGISAKTLTRRLERLVQGGAVWSVPLLDFSRHDGGVVARFLVRLDEKASATLVAQRLRVRFPNLLEFDNTYAILPEASEGQHELMLQLQNAAAIEDAEREILSLPGVTGTEVLLPRRLLAFRHWFDERLVERLRTRI